MREKERGGKREGGEGERRKGKERGIESCIQELLPEQD